MSLNHWCLRQGFLTTPAPALWPCTQQAHTPWLLRGLPVPREAPGVNTRWKRELEA